MKKYKILFAVLAVWLSVDASAAGVKTYIIPSKMEGVKETSILLNGDWQFRFSPGSKWTSVKVPGEAAMQGYAIEHDSPFWYKKTFTLPRDFAGKRVILRFDGVYSYAKLTVNGKFVREHKGGFTRWETDVTQFVKPGGKNEILLEVTDPLSEISYAAGYAHHPIGGILRDVTVFALPQAHAYDFFVETHLDSLYNDAVLKLVYNAELDGDAEIEYTLHDPAGNEVPAARSKFRLNAGKTSFVNEIPVASPMKWDAEHPNLYKLNADIKQGGRTICSFERMVGFRDIKIEGSRMLVNGKPVKLRGACRHDIHPDLGRTTTAELDSLDAVMFKRSNMNFVRTSHYPPSDKFLEYCDRFGIYVECEAAVCFANTYRNKNYGRGATQNDPGYRDNYLLQYQEMVKSFYSHPSVLFWSLGNESTYGENIRQCWIWSKETDKTRPVIFSYPGWENENKEGYDILSMHYPAYTGDLEQFGFTTRGFQGHGIPALFDEWAHPACYTYWTLQEDPNIREFWGKSLDMMWEGVFKAPGALGGATWGYIDEIFMLPKPKMGEPYWKEFARTAKPENYLGDCVGYGEWGIVDIWRRPKPEFWASKKAYSPVKIMVTRIDGFVPGERLFLPVHNRFDHTDLDEVKITYTYKGVEKELGAVSVQPHGKGLLTIPAGPWKEGEKILVRAYDNAGELIDAEDISLGKEKIDFPVTKRTGVLTVDETADKIVVKGSGFEFPFDKKTGLIHNAVVDGRVVIEQGPFLNMDINLNHLTGAEIRKRANKYLLSDGDWQKTGLAWNKDGDNISVKLSGRYQEVAVDMHIVFTPGGKIEMNYVTSGEPNGYLRETGVKFYLPETLNYLKWKRNGYWSYYPDGEFAGNEGEAAFYDSRQSAYGQHPVQPWGDDTRNYFYWADAGANCLRPLTQAAKGMKENIWYYTLSADNKEGTGFSVVSKDASLACRTNKRADEQLVLYVNNRWDYPEIAWGNYCKTLEALPNYGSITLQF